MLSNTKFKKRILSFKKSRNLKLTYRYFSFVLGGMLVVLIELQTSDENIIHTINFYRLKMEFINEILINSLLEDEKLNDINFNEIQ